MKLVVIPSYKEIFGEEPPVIRDLIADVPSKAIIGLLSAINAELFLSGSSDDVQLKLFRFITERFSENHKKQIIKGIYPYIKSSKNFIPFFSLQYTTAFIEYELLNFREFELEDTNPEQEFRIFKSYLIIIQTVNDKDLKIFDKTPIKQEEKDRFFQIKTWPLLINQFDFNYKVEPIFQIIKSLVLFDFLSRNELTQQFCARFLSVVQRENLKQYVFDFLELIKVSFNFNEKLNFRNFSLNVTPEFEPFLDNFSIDIPAYKSDKRLQIDFLGIRKKPLFKILPGTYLVMNWNYLYNQVNLGLQFDFYERSGVKEKFKTFPDFKNFIASHVSERMLFNNLIGKALKKKYSTTVFDEKYSDGAPDCYHREGKYVFLFEFKDCLMPADVIHSSDYKKIIADIDSKFITNKSGKNKGIYQLLNQIKILNNNPLEFDNYREEGIKKRNIVIYPIIVYTHFMYSMPGINQYLNNKFKRELNIYKSNNDFELSKIQDLTMIDFEFFYRNFLSLKKNCKVKVKSLIDEYHEKVRALEKKAARSGDVNEYIKSFLSFDEMKFDILNKEKQKYEDGFVRSILDAVEITPEFENI